jgi:hypothetical protein
METAKDITDQLINRVKNLKEFVVERDFNDIPLTGVIKYSIQHSQGKMARIFVHALNQREAESLVDKWLKDDCNDW